MVAMKNLDLDGGGGRPARWTDVALSGMYEISRVLTRPERIETTLSDVIALLTSYLGMHRALIALLGDDGEPQVVVGSGWNEETALSHFEHLPERAVGQIVVSQSPLVVMDMASDPLFAGWEAWDSNIAELHCTFIGVPIKDRDQVIGTITIERNYQEHSLVSIDEDVRFLTMIAGLVGQTVRLQLLIARDREHLMQEGHRIEKVLDAKSSKRKDGVDEIVGESRAVRSILEKIAIVARTSLPVLLRGESGTGKELFAQAVHNLSSRKNQACIKVNCAALPESVLESELFGHEKGAFTGAVAQRKGRFELADGGTIFLDEIGDISASFQAKLLRVLQEGEFERVGGTRTMKVDVRLVAATNRNLEEAVANGTFRSDLYYRISVVPIVLAPLRERREDIPLLAREFLGRYNKDQGTEFTLSEDALAVLASCDFPGNVRELESCVRRTAAFARGSRISAQDFACKNDSCLSSVLSKAITDRHVQRHGYIPLPVAPSAAAVKPRLPASTLTRIDERSAPLPIQPVAPLPIEPAQLSGDAPPFGALDDPSEREHLTQAMEKAGWVQAKAARLLGITPRQMGYALRKHGIPIQRF